MLIKFKLIVYYYSFSPLLSLSHTHTLFITELLFFFKQYLFLYLAAPGLSCCYLQQQDMGPFQLLRGASLIVACELFVASYKLVVAAWGIQFSDQGLNLGSLHWKYGVLATLGHQGSPYYQVIIDKLKIQFNQQVARVGKRVANITFLSETTEEQPLSIKNNNEALPRILIRDIIQSS